MKKVLCTCVMIVFGLRLGIAQMNDSLLPLKSKLRLPLTASLTGLTWAGSIATLSSVWYADFEKTKFHTFDDAGDWLQMDKAGHLYTAAHLSEFGTELFRWSGLSRKQSLAAGSFLGLGFQTSIELLDGRSKGWGFSWSDMAANVLGSAWFVGQELLWNEQRFLLKFSYHPTEFAPIRPNVLGATHWERILKDYNGQTYWISFSPKEFMDNWKLPSWLCFSVGYSIDQKLVGDQDTYVTEFQMFQARRQYFLSLDVNVRNLPIRSKWLKAALRPFHYIKIPFPTIQLDNSGVKGRLFYF